MKTVSNFVKSEKYLFKDSVNSFIPRCVVVPLRQFEGDEFNSVLKEGDRVKEGQVIAESPWTAQNNGISVKAKIHSPLPGVVKAYNECLLPDGTKGKACLIELAGEFSYLGKKAQVKDYNSLSADQLISKFDEYGIVNSFKGTVSLAHEIRCCKLNKNKFVFVRLFDEDPSRMTDTFVANKYSLQVMEGAFIIAKALNAEGVIFAGPKKNPVKIDFSSVGNLPWFYYEVDVNNYPEGFKQSLIHSAKKSLKGSSKALFGGVNHRDIFVDPETCFSVYEAIVNDKPVVDRFVHVTGDCLPSSGLFRVRIGTTLESLALQCGGFKRKPVKVVINGVITGNAVSSLKTPVTKEVKSITFLPVTDLSDQHTELCVRCGNCRAVCPEGIYPDLLYRHAQGGKPVGVDLLETVRLCSECSLCNSVCPARIPLSQTISLFRENNNE